MISIEDFKKIEIVAGKILLAEKVPETNKLLKLSVDLGPIFATVSTDMKVMTDKPAGEDEEGRDIRQIISGIAEFFPDYSALVGRTCMFVANLEPRMIRGLESQGMILAVSTEDGKFSLFEPTDDIPPGTRAK